MLSGTQLSVNPAASAMLYPPAPSRGEAGGSSNGAISGGLLRPGALDQSQFQRMLQEQYQPRPAVSERAGLTLGDYRRLSGAPAPPGSGVPTLSAAQFAALTGETPPAAGDPVPPPDQSDQAVAASAPMELGQREFRPAEPGPAAPAADPALAGGAAGGTRPGADALETGAGTGAQTDSRVVWVDQPPDRDERRTLAGEGKRWALRETPGARELFLGPDGEFGWDDFVDLINPLQHIPIVAQIYRAVTGDQAYGLANFAGALPFGPISVASVVIDTIVRSATGRDAGTDLAAAVLGIDNRTPEEANLNVVWDQQRQDGDLAAGEPAGGGGLASQRAALPTDDIARESGGASHG